MAVPSSWHPAMQFVPPPPPRSHDGLQIPVAEIKYTLHLLYIPVPGALLDHQADFLFRHPVSRIPDAQQIAYENCAFESTHMKGAAAQEKAFIGTAPNLEITSGAHIPTLLDTSSPNTKAPRNNRLPIPSGCFFIRNEKTLQAHCLQGFQMVTGAGFEPATFRL